MRPPGEIKGALEEPPEEERGPYELGVGRGSLGQGSSQRLVRACPGPPRTSHVPAQLETRGGPESEAARPWQTDRLRERAR